MPVGSKRPAPAEAGRAEAPADRSHLPDARPAAGRPAEAGRAEAGRAEAPADRSHLPDARPAAGRPAEAGRAEAPADRSHLPDACPAAGRGADGGRTSGRFGRTGTRRGGGLAGVAGGPGRPRRDRVARPLAIAGVVLTVAAVTTAAGAVWARGSADRPAVSAAPATGSAPARIAARAPAGSRPVARPAIPSRPLSVRIPAIGVSSTLVPLRLDRAGALLPPADFVHAGWYVGGPVPGEQGPAVIAGHVDSRAGPAIFFRLRDLRPGDEVLVARSDRRTVRFRVVEVQRYPKNMFPAARVYQPTPDAALRLITCGGSFDYARRSYRDNIVVYAVGS